MRVGRGEREQKVKGYWRGPWLWSPCASLLTKQSQPHQPMNTEKKRQSHLMLMFTKSLTDQQISFTKTHYNSNYNTS